MKQTIDSNLSAHLLFDNKDYIDKNYCFFIFYCYLYLYI